MSRSNAVIKFIADRGLAIAALVGAAIAVTVVFIDRAHRAEMHGLAVQQMVNALHASDVRWQKSLSESDARWQAALNENDARWADTQRRSDSQWSLAYKELERESRLTQQDYADMKVEFLRVGMNPHPHMKGESP